MTKPMMDLRTLVEKSADADLLREMIGFAAERLMELEVGAKTNAEYGEKSTERTAQRNGYRLPRSSTSPGWANTPESVGASPRNTHTRHLR